MRSYNKNVDGKKNTQSTIMSTSNNIILNQEEIMDHYSTPPLPLSLVLLSFGNILNKFPEFLLQVLPYIADRIVWNSIASSSKMIYYRTKEDEESYLPPWPFNFKLRVDFYDPAGIISNPVWSPDGTQIAYATYSDWDSTYYNYIIVIYDQRRGLLRFQPIGHISENDDSDIDWFPTLRFSPGGSILVSAGNGDGLVKIWDYNTTGYHLQLQQWNIGQELDADISSENLEFDISPCSRYVVVLSGRHVLLKDVQNNGKTIKSVLLPENEIGYNIMFSDNDGHAFILISCWDEEVDDGNTIIKTWYLHDFDDEGDGPNTNASLITILKSCEIYDLVLSHDKSMLAAIYEDWEDNNKVLLYSIENGNKSATRSKLILKHSFSARCSPIRFTPDDNYIAYKNQNGLAFWNITTGRESTDKTNILYNENKNIGVIDFSPAGSGQRLIVRDHTGGYYIASFLGK